MLSVVPGGLLTSLAAYLSHLSRILKLSVSKTVAVLLNRLVSRRPWFRGRSPEPGGFPRAPGPAPHLPLGTASGGHDPRAHASRTGTCLNGRVIGW